MCFETLLWGSRPLLVAGVSLPPRPFPVGETGKGRNSLTYFLPGREG